MDDKDKFFDDAKAFQLRQAQKVKNEKLYKETVKRRLIKFLEKKMKTTMIGAIARFEDKFGKLWGHGETNPSREQKEFRILWEAVRTEILNNGNNQLRAMQEELNRYNVEEVMFNTQFIMKKEPSDVE